MTAQATCTAMSAIQKMTFLKIRLPDGSDNIFAQLRPDKACRFYTAARGWKGARARRTARGASSQDKSNSKSSLPRVRRTLLSALRIASASSRFALCNVSTFSSIVSRAMIRYANTRFT